MKIKLLPLVALKLEVCGAQTRGLEFSGFGWVYIDGNDIVVYDVEFFNVGSESYTEIDTHIMVELANRFATASGLLRRALNQAARELMLAQSSDWAFIMTTGTCNSYAETRTRDHLARFNGIYLQITGNRLEESWIAELEWLDSIFQEIDYRVYRD